MRVTGCKGVNWIHLAEYTVQWRAVMNIVICLWFVWKGVPWPAW